MNNDIQQLNQKIDNLTIKLNQIYAKLNNVSASVTANTSCHNVPSCDTENVSTPTHPHRLKDVHAEAGYYANFPVSAEEDPAFKDKFLTLTRGLDCESVLHVTQIIQRLRKLKNSTDNLLPEFTDVEMQDIRYVNEDFENEILRLADGCYFYNGYLLPNSRFEPCVFLYGCGIEDVEHAERFENKDIIDAGAYIGDSALLFSRLTSRNVYAFEPTQTNYQDMQKTIEMNALSNVVPCKYALGDTASKIEMTNAVVSSSNAFVDKSTMPYTSTETVDVITLDSFVA